MERTRISTGVSVVGKIFKFAPIPISSVATVFFVLESDVEARAIIVIASIFVSAILYILGRRMVNTVVVFYDEENLYVESAQRKYRIALADIQALEQTRSYVNSVPLWRVSFHADELVTMMFMPQYTIWNRAFPAFLDHLRKVNPAAIKSDYRPRL